MTEEETVALGNYCESLMRSDGFNALTQMFKQQEVAAILGTAPENSKSREASYANVHGVQNFLGMMRSLVQQRDQIIMKNDAEQQAATTQASQD